MNDWATTRETFVAACPACGDDAVWTARPVAREFHMEIRYTIAGCRCEENPLWR